MKKFLNILNNKVTIGSILSVMASFTFAALLRMAFADFLDIGSIEIGLNFSNLSFVSIIALFRLIFSALLEYSFGDKMLAPLGTVIKDFDISLKMEDKNTASSGSSKDLPSSSSSKHLPPSGSSKDLPSSSSSKHLPSSSSSKHLPSKDFPVKEQLKLLDEFGNNTDVQEKMIGKLHTLKLEKDLKYFEDEEGNLSLSAPSNTSDEELERLSKQVGIIDRIVKTKFSEYKKLVKKDVDQNSGGWSEAYDSQVKHYKQQYKDLFDKE